MHSKWGIVAAATTVFALAFSMGNSNLPEASAEEAVPSVNISAPVQIESLSTPVQSGKLLQEVGEVEVTAAISDGADTYSLYPEFKDPGEAIKKCKITMPSLFFEILFNLRPCRRAIGGITAGHIMNFLILLTGLSGSSKGMMKFSSFCSSSISMKTLIRTPLSLPRRRTQMFRRFLRMRLL